MKRQSLTWLTVVLLVASAGAGMWLWQRQQNDEEVAALETRVDQLQSQADQLSEALAGIATDEAGPAATGDQVVDASDAPVVFDPPGQFSNDLQQEIELEILTPHELYHFDQERNVAAYYITPTDEQREYAVTAIFTGGNNGYEGFVVGGNEELAWTPNCQENCEFSEEFTNTYPEIVERAQ